MARYTEQEMTSAEKLIEQTAFKFRQHIRAKAGLLCDWDKMDEDMYAFYFNKAYNYLVANGELVVEE